MLDKYRSKIGILLGYILKILLKIENITFFVFSFSASSVKYISNKVISSALRSKATNKQSKYESLTSPN